METWWGKRKSFSFFFFFCLILFVGWLVLSLRLSYGKEAIPELYPKPSLVNMGLMI